jgi:ParB family chromosome partitioning protein
MSTEQIQYPALEQITTAPQIRKRFDPEIVAAMSRSLRELGQLQPIRVRRLGDKFVIVDGELRYRAAKMAGFSTMAVIIEEKELCEGEVIHRQLVSNCHRANLNDVEKAKAIELLMKETGWNATQTAAKLGFANSTITKLLSLLLLPEPIQQRIRACELPATAGYDLSRISDAGEQEALAGRVIDGELTRDGLSGAIKVRKRNHHARKNSARRCSRITAKLENRQSVTVSAPALDLSSFVAILETLLGHAHEALTEGLTLDGLLKRLKTGRLSAAPAIEAG